MSAPLSPASYEVAKALGAGLKLRLGEDSYELFSGTASVGAVEARLVEELVRNDYAERCDSEVALTKKGAEAVSERAKALFDKAIEWLRSKESLLSN
jgi:hypothetical protein